jgi:methylated-DNA-[protein]-cysteine S-methyltransferase
MPITEFQERVYALLMQIPPGRVTTYAALARALHTHPRAIGNALRNNPFAPDVPCHRCVASDGYVTGYHGEVIYKESSKRSKNESARGKARQSKGRVGKVVEKGQKEGEKRKTIPPSGINVRMKLELLKGEGVEFDERGMLIDEAGKVLWDGPWDMERRWDEAEKEAE